MLHDFKPASRVHWQDKKDIDSQRSLMWAFANYDEEVQHEYHRYVFRDMQNVLVAVPFSLGGIIFPALDVISYSRYNLRAVPYTTGAVLLLSLIVDFTLNNFVPNPSRNTVNLRRLLAFLIALACVCLCSFIITAVYSSCPLNWDSPSSR